MNTQVGRNTHRSRKAHWGRNTRDTGTPRGDRNFLLLGYSRFLHKQKGMNMRNKSN